MEKLKSRKTQSISNPGGSAVIGKTAFRGFSFFGFSSSARSNVCSVTSKVSIKEPLFKGVPLSKTSGNMAAIEKWVGLEEKIVHDYKTRSPISAEPASRRFSLRRFFSSTPSVTSNKNAKIFLKEPLLKGMQLSKTSPKMAVIEKWVGLEEKIVHDYKARRPISEGAASRNFLLPNFFSSIRSVTPNKNSKVSPKGPPLNGTPLNKTSESSAAIAKWVDLEEKSVHDYKNRRMPPPRVTPNLSVSSSVSYAAGIPAMKKSFPASGPSMRWGAVLWVCGLALAGILAFFYARELPRKQEASSKIAGILAEKGRLEQSYAKIKTVSEEQREKLKQQSRRIQKMNEELQVFRDNAADYDFLEKTYRQELMRITIDYEIKLDSLRGFLRTRDEIIAALRAQMQALEQMIDQGSLAAVSGAASQAAQGELSRRDTPASPGGDDFLQGKVTEVNARQGFFAVNIGAEHGARSGGLVTIYRNGARVGKGVMDRVYPTMSSVTMADRSALYSIRVGDRVSL